jgi:hypothetical protein
MSIDTWSSGPQLHTARRWPACGRIAVVGQRYLVVIGDMSKNRVMEILDTKHTNPQWQSIDNIPSTVGTFYVGVTDFDQQWVVIVGGTMHGYNVM